MLSFGVLAQQVLVCLIKKSGRYDICYLLGIHLKLQLWKIEPRVVLNNDWIFVFVLPRAIVIHNILYALSYLSDLLCFINLCIFKLSTRWLFSFGAILPYHTWGIRTHDYCMTLCSIFYIYTLVVIFFLIFFPLY